MVLAHQLQECLMRIETADNKLIGLVIIAVLGFHPLGTAVFDHDFADRFGTDDHPAVLVKQLAHHVGQMVASTYHQAVVGCPVEV